MSESQDFRTMMDSASLLKKTDYNRPRKGRNITISRPDLAQIRMKEDGGRSIDDPKLSDVLFKEGE